MKSFICFLPSISPKENITVWLEFELAYFKVAVQYLIYYTTKTALVLDSVFNDSN